MKKIRIVGKNSDDKAKNKKIPAKKKKLIYIAVTLLTVILLTGVTYIFGGFESIDYFLFYRHRVIDPTVISDGGFPVIFTSGDIISADNISSKAAILSDKLLTCVSYKGRVLYTESFTFVDPEMKTNGKYGVVFDKGSDKFFIFDAYKIVYQGTTEDGRNIITADVDNKGNVVISTKSNDSACRVYMIDKKGEVKYIWSCAESYVVSMDISKDSEKIICGAIGAYNYEIYTDIYVLDIYSDTAVSTQRINESACVDVMYLGNSKIIANCSDKRVIFDVSSDGELSNNPSRIAFHGDTVLMDFDSSGNVAVLTERFNSPDTKELTLYDKDNNIIFTYSTPSDVVAVRCADEKVYCLTEKKIITYCEDSEKRTEYQCDMFGEGLVELRGKIRYYSSYSIKNGF